MMFGIKELSKIHTQYGWEEKKIYDKLSKEKQKQIFQILREERNSFSKSQEIRDNLRKEKENQSSKIALEEHNKYWEDHIE